MSSMTIGELVGYVDLDIDQLRKGTKQGEADMVKLSAAVLANAQKIENTKILAKLDADASELKVEIDQARAALTYLSQYRSTPKIDADISAAEMNVSRIRSDLERLNWMQATPEVRAEIAAAEADMRRAQSELDRLNHQRATLDVDAETASASAALRRLEAQAASLNSQRIRLKMDVDSNGMGRAAGEAARLTQSAMSAASAIMAIGAAVPAIGMLGAALSAAASAAALLPAALAAAGAAVGGLMVGLSGIGDAFSAMGASAGGAGSAGAGAADQQAAALKGVENAQRAVADAQEQARRTGIQGAQQIADAQEAVADAVRRAAQVAADGARQIADAQEAVTDAIRRADKVAQDGARQVASARQAVADAIASSARRVESAEASLERSQRSARDAQMALNRAREDAKDRIEDLTLALSGAALDEEAAQLRLERAQQRLAEASRKGRDSLDFKEAELGVRQAEQALAETKDRYNDVQKEAADANAKGVEGADNVVAAQQRVDDANRQVADSAKALDQARVDGARDVQRAQESLALAEQNAAEANAEAARSVAKAKEQLARTEQEVAQANIDATRDVEKAKQQLARTEQQVAWANEDAAKRVADAQRALADAMEQVGKAAGGGGAGGVDKFAEALAKLSPEARQFVLAIKALSDEWKALTWAVQDALFDGLAEEITALAGKYLPMLQSMLVTVAGGFNTAAKGFSQWLQQTPQVEMVRGAMERTGQATSLFAQALNPLLQAFTGLWAIGSEFLPSMAQGFLDSATAAANFVNSAEGSQQIREWITQGLEVLGQLWDLLTNIGRIIGAVFSAGNDGGLTFLETLIRLTDQLATFLEAPATQQALQALFQFLADNGPMLASLAIGIWGVSKALSAASAVAAGITGFKTILETFGLIGGGADGAKGKVATFAIDGIKNVAKFASGLAIRAAGMAISWLIAMGPIGWIIAAVVGLAALIYIYWDEIKAATIAAWGAISEWLSTTWESIKTAATEAWTAFTEWLSGLWESVKAIFTGALAAIGAWLVSSWQSMVTSAQGAWQSLLDWLSGLWESIKSVVSAAIAWVVSWLITKWLEIKTSAQQSWQAIRDTLTQAWETIKSTVSGAATAVLDWLRNAWNNAVTATRNAWDQAVAAVRTGIDNALNFVRQLPGNILNALSNAGTLLYNVGLDLMRGLWNGIQANWQWLLDSVRNVATSLLNSAKSALGIASPSKLMRDLVGRWIPEGIAVGVEGHASVATDAVTGMARDAVSQAQSIVSAADFAEIEAFANSRVADARQQVQDRLAAAGIRTASPDQGQRAGTTVVVNNPLPERGSDSLNRQARTLGALGII